MAHGLATVTRSLFATLYRSGRTRTTIRRPSVAVVVRDLIHGLTTASDLELTFLHHRAKQRIYDGSYDMSAMKLRGGFDALISDGCFMVEVSYLQLVVAELEQRGGLL